MISPISYANSLWVWGLSACHLVAYNNALDSNLIVYGLKIRKMPKCFFSIFHLLFFLNFFFASFNAEPYSNLFFFEKCCLFFVILKPTMNFFQKCNSICALYHDLHQVPKGHIYSRGFGNWNQLGCGLWTQLGIIELFLLLLWKQKIPQNGDIYRRGNETFMTV